MCRAEREKPAPNPTVCLDCGKRYSGTEDCPTCASKTSSKPAPTEQIPPAPRTERVPPAPDQRARTSPAIRPAAQDHRSASLDPDPTPPPPADEIVLPDEDDEAPSQLHTKKRAEASRQLLEKMRSYGFEVT